jgi:4-hydroxybenzoate polyprenyl transferase
MKLSSCIRLTRLNQPIGIWLLFLPCLMGIFLALKNLPQNAWEKSLPTIFLFFAGAVIMRCAGCVINDLLDEKFDKKVERTKTRPIAAKEISRLQALILLGFLLFFALLILLQFNFQTILSGFVALALVATYPLMKRITYYPQVFLGLTFNFGILMSSLAMLERITLASLILYFACVIWTVIYDTIYAYQDVEDDLKIGVKSTAIKFRNNPKKILIWLNLIIFSSLVLLGWIGSFESGFFLAILSADLFLNYKIKQCDFSNAQSCLKVFKSNIWFGLLLLTAIILA